MGVSQVFDFFIDSFITIFLWFYNLSIPINDTLSIPFGHFLLAFIVLALCVRIFFHFNDFNIFDNKEELVYYREANNYYGKFNGGGK